MSDGKVFYLGRSGDLVGHSEEPVEIVSPAAPRLIVVRVNLQFDKEYSRMVKELALTQTLYRMGLKEDIRKRTNMDYLGLKLEEDERIAWYYLSSQHGYDRPGVRAIRASILPNVMDVFQKEVDLVIDGLSDPLRFSQKPWLVSIEGIISERRLAKFAVQDSANQTRWSKTREIEKLAA